jgi:hypothetical protein
MPDRDLTDLTGLTLKSGSHRSPEEGLCLMEAVAWFRGQPHGDRPACVSPVLGAYGRSLNDSLTDQARQGLIRFIPRMPGTAGDGLDRARLDVLTRWAVRSWAARWLDLAGLREDAARLRSLVIPSWPAIGGGGGLGITAASAEAAAEAGGGAAEAAVYAVYAAEAAFSAAVASEAAEAAFSAAVASEAAGAAFSAAEAAEAAEAAFSAAVASEAAGAAFSAAVASAGAAHAVGGAAWAAADDAEITAAEAAAWDAAGASAEAAWELARHLRDLVLACRQVSRRCVRLIAYQSVAGISEYGAGRKALAPMVAEFQGLELLDALIAPAASRG